MEEIAEQVIYLCDKHGKPEMVADAAEEDMPEVIVDKEGFCSLA